MPSKGSNVYSMYDAQPSVRGLDILRLQLFVLHKTDTISFPLFSSRFLRYKQGCRAARAVVP
jgi:hypothetical protein